MDEVAKHAAITSQGKLIKEMKASKAAKEALATEVATLLSLKAEYKAAFGKEYEPIASSEPPPAPPSAKKEKAAAAGGAPVEKEGESKSKKTKGEKKEKETGSSSSEAKQQTRFVPPPGLCFYPSPTDANANFKCWLVAASLKCQIATELAAGTRSNPLLKHK